MASPLPVSNTHAAPSQAATTATVTTSIDAVESQQAPASPGFRTFVNNTAVSIRNNFSQRRPWPELVDRTTFSKPESFSDALVRIRANYTYFRVNYLAVIAGVLAFSLVKNPYSLVILFGLLCAWIFLYLFRPSEPPLVMFGRTFAEREILCILILLSIVVVFLTSVGSVLVSALMAGLAIVCIHGAFRTPDALFLEEQKPAPAAFLPIIGKTPANPPIVAAPPIVTASIGQSATNRQT